jgi:hypothetical protein
MNKFRFAPLPRAWRRCLEAAVLALAASVIVS